MRRILVCRYWTELLLSVPTPLRHFHARTFPFSQNPHARSERRDKWHSLRKLPLWKVGSHDGGFADESTELKVSWIEILVIRAFEQRVATVLIFACTNYGLIMGQRNGLFAVGLTDQLAKHCNDMVERGPGFSRLFSCDCLTESKKYH